MGKFYHLFYLSNLLGVNLQSGALLVRTEEQINEADDQKECYYSADTESTGGDQRTDLIYTQGYHICQTALISDSDPEPSGIVHLTLDRTHSCEARCAQQVECQESITACYGEGSGHVRIYGTFACAVEDTHSTYDVLLCYQTGDGCNGCLPVTEALRMKIHARH